MACHGARRSLEMTDILLASRPWFASKPLNVVLDCKLARSFRNYRQRSARRIEPPQADRLLATRRCRGNSQQRSLRRGLHRHTAYSLSDAD